MFPPPAISIILSLKQWQQYSLSSKKDDLNLGNILRFPDVNLYHCLHFCPKTSFIFEGHNLLDYIPDLEVCGRTGRGGGGQGKEGT